MKTAIVYATKHNFTEKCVQKLSQKLEGTVEMFNLKNSKLTDANQYDNIIVGGPIYAGQLLKELKEFCTENTDILKSKKIGLFVCGLSNEEKISSEFNQFYPEILINASVAKGFFGGAAIFKNMSFFEKFIMKLIMKSSKDINNLNEDGIDKFAAAMNKQI